MYAPPTAYDFEFWGIDRATFKLRMHEFETMLAPKASWRANAETIYGAFAVLLGHLHHYQAGSIPHTQSNTGQIIRLDRKWLETGKVPSLSLAAQFEAINFEVITG